jgi:hypothetical protein
MAYFLPLCRLPDTLSWSHPYGLTPTAPITVSLPRPFDLYRRLLSSDFCVLYSAASSPFSPLFPRLDMRLGSFLVSSRGV